MRARPARRHALILGTLLTALPAPADEAPAPSSKAAARPPAKAPAIEAPSPAVAPATPADVARERLATGARIKELSAVEAKDRPAVKAALELLEERQRLLVEWEKAARERAAAEHPEPSPEREAAEARADLEKTVALLGQAARAPDSILPEVFQARARAAGSGTAPSEARLAEMKDAIDSARAELKERAAELEALRADGARSLTSEVAALRADRDRLHQGFVALTARRGERLAAAATGSPEARDLARDRLANFDWSARVEAERLAALEARIALAGKRLDLGASRVQALGSRVQLARKVVERMEDRYSATAELQRSDLKRAVAKEETRAAQSRDPLEQRRARRTAELLDLESQVVAYEKAYATSGGGDSLQEQTTRADAAEAEYAQLRRMVEDGNVSPLDALRLKNDFRRIMQERAQVVRTDLARTEAEQVAYENALTDAEIDLVNDSRDDRYDRDSLLEQVSGARRAEASAMLEELEAKHHALLNRRRNVLQKLAGRADETHRQVARRIETLDQQFAFIRTHIFWIRDAEPLGPATLDHARAGAIRAAKALVRLAIEPADGKLWGPVTAEFVLVALALAVLPWPLLLGQRALDRIRLGAAPAPAPAPTDFEARAEPA